MNTPICDFVENYVNQKPVRAHMPGHKGTGLPGCEARDITEVEGAGALYLGGDVIAESERNAAALFGTGKTLYSVEGSSLAIRAMLYLARLSALAQGRTPRILAARNAHKAFLSAVALLDLAVDWLLPEDGSVLSCTVTPEALERRLADEENQPTSIYITSPDYLGNLADIAGLAAVCRRYQCLLLVDNAHGAYLRFSAPDRHPISLGADLCCDSAHKTLPVLTGGAYLHLAKGCPPLLSDAAESAMQLFASTSPSYLILQSLDAVNAQLAQDYPARLAVSCARLDEIRSRLTAQGYTLLGNEPLKLTLDARAYGYRGTELAALLRDAGIVCEFADPDVTVLMLSPCNTEAELCAVERVLCAIPRKKPIHDAPPMLPVPAQALSIRAAMLAPSELLPICQCEGRILAQPSVFCPPAVPIAVCGERLGEQHLALLRYYGLETCRVVA